MTAQERRADVLRVAVHEFARTGFQGTSTEDVARAAGISQPYLFKMFPTKKALFIALIEQGFGRVRQAFVEATADTTGDDALGRMGERYGELLPDRDELLLQMQAYAACDDPERSRGASSASCGGRSSDSPAWTTSGSSSSSPWAC